MLLFFRSEYTSPHSVGVQRGQRDQSVTVSGVQENSVIDAGREELYRRVDEMVDGSDVMKEEAYNLLKDKSYLVGMSYIYKGHFGNGHFGNRHFGNKTIW